MAGPIDLARARREAKRLLAAARRREPAALARLSVPDPRLSDAQLAFARELGASSWPALVHRAEAESVARADRARRLVEAATDGRRDRAEALLAAGAGNGRPALDAALVLGDAERLRAELAADPKLAGRPLGTRTWLPLLYLTHSVFLGGPRTDGLLAAARALLAAGADPNASFRRAESGPASALYGAAGLAHEPRMTALLLDAGANPDDNESVYHAVAAADTACLELLLAAGADVRRTNALANALGRGRPDVVGLLLDRMPADWGERRYALQWAVGAGESAEVVRLLVERGADLEALDDGADRTPYGLAVRSGRADLAVLLARLGAERRVGPVDALLGACFAGDREEARRLAVGSPETLALVRRAHADALVEAAGDLRPVTVTLLLDLGLPIDARGQFGGTALHHAAWRGDTETLDLLLARGADLAKRSTTFDMSALGWAVHGSVNAPPGGDHAAVAERLVAAGLPVEPGMADEAALELAEWLHAHAAAAPPDVPDDEAGGGMAVVAADEPPYAELEWAAEAAYLRLLATSPLTDTRAVAGDGIAVITGVRSNTENGVVADAAPDDLAALLAWFAEREAPARWLVGPTPEPPDLGGRLVDAGAIAETSAVLMGAELAALHRGVVSPEIRIVAVEDAAGFEAWSHAAQACRFIDPGAQRARWAAVLASLPPDGPLRHRLALRDGAVAGFASYLVHGETALGLHVGVLPAQRRAGVGAALLVHVADEARRAGARVAVLGPTPETIPIYRGLGFVLRPALTHRSYYLPM